MISVQLLSLLSFSFVFSLLPLRVVPLFARFAFISVLFLILFPAPSSNLELNEFLFKLMKLEFGISGISYLQSLFAIAYGILTAVLVSVGAYSVFCFSKWASYLIFGDEWSEQKLPASLGFVNSSVLQAFFSLVFVSVLVLVVGVGHIAEFLHLGIVGFSQYLPLGNNVVEFSKVAFVLVVEAGRFAFLSGLLLGLPLFLTSLLVDFVTLVSNRYLESENWWRVLRTSVLLLMLFLILPELSLQVVDVAKNGMQKKEIIKVNEMLKGADVK